MAFRPDKCDRPKPKVYCAKCLYFLSKHNQRYVPANDVCCTRPEKKDISYKTPTHLQPPDTLDGKTLLFKEYLELCMIRNKNNDCQYFKENTWLNKLFDKDYTSADVTKCGE